MNSASRRIGILIAIGVAALAAANPPPGPPSDSKSQQDEGGIAGFPCPNPGAACCEGTTTTGCEDAACCNLVCSIDPFCCSTLWDNICGAEAQQYCTYCGGTKPAPPNDNCEDALDWSEVPSSVYFSTIGATTDGPSIEYCMFFFGDPQVRQDIWYRIVAPETGLLKVSVCDSDFDTRLVVYGTCACPVLATDEIVCADDSGTGCGNGLQSRVEFFAKQGECYTVRIGGFFTSQGTGTMTLEYGELCKLDCPPDSFFDYETCGFEKSDFCGGMSLCDGPFPDCCEAHLTPSCRDPACSKSICLADPFCCEVQWDDICADAACLDPNCQCDHVSIDPWILSCGDSICGEIWAVDGKHDVDEYLVGLPMGGLATWSVTAQVPVESSIFDSCDEKIIATSQADCGEVAQASLVVPPGATYWVRVRPVILDDLPCGSGNNGYVATLTCDVCFTDIDDNGVTNVDDLLVVINGWGDCETPPCASDVDLNGATNVDDLLHVVNHWGECL